MVNRNILEFNEGDYACWKESNTYVKILKINTSAYGYVATVKELILPFQYEIFLAHLSPIPESKSNLWRIFYDK